VKLNNFVLGTVLMACVVAFAAETPPTTFYVCPEGKDTWPGTSAEPTPDGSDGPLATLETARDAARRVGTDVPRRIVVGEGSYFITQTLLLDPRDSGLTIEEAPGTRPILYGGTRIEGWEPDGERFWTAALPEVTDGSWDFRMLSVNGRFCKRARLPVDGAFEHESTFNVPWMSSTGGGWKRKPTEEELTTIKFRPEDLGPWFDPKNAEVTVYHMWDESLVGVAGMDRESSTLTFSTPSEHPPGAFGVKRYVVWNRISTARREKSSIGPCRMKIWLRRWSLRRERRSFCASWAKRIISCAALRCGGFAFP